MWFSTGKDEESFSFISGSPILKNTTHIYKHTALMRAQFTLLILSSTIFLPGLPGLLTLLPGLSCCPQNILSTPPSKMGPLIDPSLPEITSKLFSTNKILTCLKSKTQRLSRGTKTFSGKESPHSSAFLHNTSVPFLSPCSLKLLFPQSPLGSQPIKF